MENRSIKSQLEFEIFLTEKLSYLNMSTMTFEEYMNFTNNLFDELNELRNDGIQREDILDFVKDLYASVMSNYDDDDILFERRFSAITEELIAFCPDPIFWYTDFNLYMKKWEKYFQDDWLKKT